MLIFSLVNMIWPGGEVANAAVCKTAIHGCNSHLGLKIISGEWWNGIHAGLKILWDLSHVGSSPTSPIDFMLGENRKKIILTADDFGKSGKANESILNLAKMGKLDRVSVMSEGVFTAREIEELKNAGVKIDIHLELDWQKKRRGRTRERTAKQVIVFLANYIRRNRVKR